MFGHVVGFCLFVYHVCVRVCVWHESDMNCTVEYKK